MKQQFYVTLHRFSGITKTENADADYIAISTEPLRYMDGPERGQVCKDGYWGATINDEDAYAISTHNTLEAARKAITKWGKTREGDGSNDPETVETYKIGEYEPLDQGDIRHTMSALDYEDRITPETTDKELSKIANDFLAMLKENQEEADPETVMSELKALRNEIREEAEEDEEA